MKCVVVIVKRMVKKKVVCFERRVRGIERVVLLVLLLVQLMVDLWLGRERKGGQSRR